MNHIVSVELPPRSEGIHDQREITIQSYQTTVPFDRDAIQRGLASAWLSPQIRFGVFALTPTDDEHAVNVVLGLQDELSVRAYDYDERRALWYCWQNIIVDTVNIRYFRGGDGLLRFNTIGGGKRITEDRLNGFHEEFLNLLRGYVTKRHFDLAKLRELCFGKFVERLYMLRFRDPSGKEYRSIDLALFQSREYIDPQAERLLEVRDDRAVTIESFDSDVELRTEDLANSAKVRFFLRGLSGSLRLRIPKIHYKVEPTTAAEQARKFYRFVEAAEQSILDADYYTHESRSLDELEVDQGMFPAMVDLTPFKSFLLDREVRETFINSMDLSAQWTQWRPQLMAIDELLASDDVSQHTSEIVGSLIKASPETGIRLLDRCLEFPRMCGLSTIVAGALSTQLQSIEPSRRAQAEQLILAWAIEDDVDHWDIELETAEIRCFELRWRLDDLTLATIPGVLWKVMGVLHQRLCICEQDTRLLLDKIAWCVLQARELSPNDPALPTALRLIAANRVPRTFRDSAKVLQNAVNDLQLLDREILNQFGLPVWPQLVANRDNGKVRISNTGIGAAIGVTVRPTDFTAADGDEADPVDVLPHESAAIPIGNDVTSVDVEFTKFEKRYRVTLNITGECPAQRLAENCVTIQSQSPINRKRRERQRVFRAAIDPEGVVVGSSSAIFEVFESIQHANTMTSNPAVLILGEPGVGKTHIAELIHKSSTRSAQMFQVVNAGGSGGDINIQRGEWIGYGKGHGIPGVNGNGCPGHLMTVNGGTLFVDEFAAMSHELQTIFLSVLDRRKIEKIGGQAITPDVRCIFATNANIDDAVAGSTLRRDLIDRIGIKIQIPPIRERLGDVLLLVRHFAPKLRFTEHCLVAFLRYDWPGNVRELQMQIERAIARKTTDAARTIDLKHLDLPPGLVSTVQALSGDLARYEVWSMADKIARGEGYASGSGLQRRAGQILGVGEPQASKMYAEHGLAISASV